MGQTISKVHSNQQLEYMSSSRDCFPPKEKKIILALVINYHLPVAERVTDLCTERSGKRQVMIFPFIS